MKPPRHRLTPAIAVLAFGVFALVISVFPGIRDLDVKALEIAQKDSIALPYSVESPERHFATLQKAQSLPFTNIHITADEQKIFAEQPPSPIDLALVLSTLRKSGHDTITLAYSPAWEDVDPISLGLLEIELQKIPSTVIGYPVTRSSSGDDMPPALIESSLLTQNHGSVPIVNRIPIQPATFGGKKTLIGFTQLENEDSDSTAPHLIAVWQDRLIFSTSVLTLALEADAMPSDFIFSPGAFLQIGPEGWKIPVDEFGRLKLPDATQEIPAPTAAKNLVTADTFEPMSQTAHISWHTSPLASDLSRTSQSPRASDPFTITQAPYWWHFASFVALAIGFSFCPKKRSGRFFFNFLLLTGVISLILALGTYSLWLSPFSLLSAWLAGVIFQPNTSSVSSTGY